MVTSTTTGNAADHAVAMLREAILSGQMPGGAPVREHELAQRLGMSRTPVREAVGRLVAEGLLMKDGNRTAHVFRPSLAELLELYEIRIPLESLAGRLACEAADDSFIEELTALGNELDNADAGLEWSLKHEQFHVCVAKGSGRPRLTALVQTFRVQSEPYVRFAVSSDNEIRLKAKHDHAEIVHFVKQRDGKALERLISEHLSATRDSVSELLHQHQNQETSGFLLPRS